MRQSGDGGLPSVTGRRDLLPYQSTADDESGRWLDPRLGENNLSSPVVDPVLHEFWHPVMGFLPGLRLADGDRRLQVLP